MRLECLAAAAAVALSTATPTPASAREPVVRELLAPDARCAPTPERLIILGDSIVDCAGVGGPDDDRCSPKQLHTWLNAEYARGVSYENLSVSGATTSTLVKRQLPTVPTGQSGHALVVIFIGGNDLYPVVYMPESIVPAVYASLEAELRGLWAEIYDFFEDPAAFPDGVTLVINTQYNPFDDCYGTSEAKIVALGQYNAMLTSFSEGVDHRYTADPYSPFLGHGHNYERNTCPYYQRGNAYWMNDLIHPNEIGHEAITEVWEDLLTPLYDGCF